MKKLIYLKKVSQSFFINVHALHLVPATGLEDEDDIILEPQPMAVIRFGIFIGDKTYAKDYLGSTSMGSNPIKDTEEQDTGQLNFKKF